MAVAEIIGAAVGILLLVIVAYLIVGGTLSVAETVATAQKDVTQINEARLRSDLRINSDEIAIEGYGLNFSVTNTGNEVIANFEHIDLFTCDNGGIDYQQYTYDSAQSGASGTWTILRIENDIIHPGQIDPGEKAWFWASFSSADPVFVQVTIDNGVTAQLTAPVEGWR